jgi:3-oxoacyl-[acyl-carrier protein] reductase
VEVRQSSEAGIAVGRYGQAEEFGAAVAFLAGRPASYITGSVVRCDGGLIASI